jgi:hypothetical protein
MNYQKYTRLGTVDIATIKAAQAAIWDGRSRIEPREPKIELFGKQVKLFSKGTRLKTFFVRGTVCSSCGLKATHYAVERPAHETGDFPYHLNLWGIDGKGCDVLFTHDHTLARSAGGADNISNTTTMCSPCNHAKSLIEKRG